MDPLTLQQIAEFAGARLIQGDGASATSVVTTDSRKLEAGALFVAIAGERFDGHDFVRQAAEIGALGAIVHRDIDGLPEDFAVLRVDDTLVAFQQLAANYRASLPVKIVAITGSNGKTSTKDLIASVLERGHKVLKTDGNFNNHIGVPITLLRLDRSVELAVLEMGMNHPGEIAPLAAMAKPEVAVITTIGMAHIEFMGSREAIALEKGMLAEAIGPEGLVILNGDEDTTAGIAARCVAPVVRAGLHGGEIRAEAIEQDLCGSTFTIVSGERRVQGELSTPGLHMVRNALFAVAVGEYFGMPLEECAAGLADATLTKGRLQRKTVHGLDVLDDTYNANPDSMVAALQTLAQLKTGGRRIAVLGRMGELGSEAEAGHKRVGAAAAEQRIDCVVSVGTEAAWITDVAAEKGLRETYNVPNTDEAARLLGKVARVGDLILVKGSRAAAMERVVEKLHIEGGIVA